MTENSKNNELTKQQGLDWQTEADIELNSSEWFGAIIRYFWHLGRKKFNTFYTPKEIKKNARIGWVFKIMLMIMLIYIFIMYTTS